MEHAIQPFIAGQPRPWGGAIEGFDERLGFPGLRWHGRILAVHGSAALAQCLTAQGVPEQIALLLPHRPLLPWSLRLPRAMGLPDMGSLVSLAHGRLTVGRGASGGAEAVLVVRGRGRPLCFPPPLCFPHPLFSPSGDPRPSAVADRAVGRAHLDAGLDALRLPGRSRALLLEGEPSGSPVSRLITAQAATGLCLMLNSLFAPAPWTGLPGALRALSGLGPGATPTGDDLLVGVTAAAWRLRDMGLLGEPRLEALRGALQRIPALHTTAPAHAMLREAGLGFYPEPLIGFLCLLVSEPARGARPNARYAQLLNAHKDEVLAIGHHSGADLVAGAVAMVTRAAKEVSQDA